MNLKVTYQTVSLDEVLRAYAEGYQLPEGYTLFRHEAYVDPGKRVVVYRLTVDVQEPEQPATDPAP